MTRPRRVTQSVLESARERGLTAPQVAAETGSWPCLVYAYAKAAGVQLAPSRVRRLDPAKYPRPRFGGGVMQCSECPALLAPPAPERCSACVARSSLALIAELIDGEMR